VKQQVAQHHQHRAAVAVNDGLGQAGGAAGIDDPDRMVERHPLRFEGGSCSVVARGGLVEPGIGLHRAAQAAQADQVLHRRQPRAQLGDHFRAVVGLVGVAHAVAGDQHLGLDLAEAVEHRVRAHVRRADAPHAAQAHHGEEGDDRLGHVGQVGRDAVAGLQALRLQVQRDRGDLAPQLGPAQLSMRALFVAADQRRKPGRMRRVHVPQHLPRVVDLGAGKPDRAGHLRLGQHRAMRRRRLDAEGVPDALPEAVQVFHRPAPELVVALE